MLIPIKATIIPQITNAGLTQVPVASANIITSIPKIISDQPNPFISSPPFFSSLMYNKYILVAFKSKGLNGKAGKDSINKFPQN